MSNTEKSEFDAFVEIDAAKRIPTDKIVPKNKAEAIMAFLDGHLEPSIAKNDNETVDAFAARHQKHTEKQLTKSLRKLLGYMISLHKNQNTSDGLALLRDNGSAESSYIVSDDLLASGNSITSGPHQIRLAALYSLITHLIKHKTEVDNGVRMRLGRYIRTDREANMILAGLGLQNIKQSTSFEDNKLTASINVSKGQEGIYDALAYAYKYQKNIADNATLEALDKFKPRRAYLWHRLGKFLAVWVSIAVLLTLMAFAFQFLGTFGLGIAAIVLAGLIAADGAWVNFKLFQNMVPETLLDFFAYTPIFSSKKTYWHNEKDLDGTVTHEVREYTAWQKFLTGLSSVFVLTASAIAAIFTFNAVVSIFSPQGAFAALAFSSSAAFPLAIVCAVVLFAVYNVLFLKSYTELIRGGLIKTIKNNLGTSLQKIQTNTGLLPSAELSDSDKQDANRQNLAAKVIFWTVFGLIFALINVGGILGGYAAAFSPTGMALFGGSAAAAWTVGVGINTLAMAGFAATSSAKFAEKVMLPLFKAFDWIGITKLPSASMVPLIGLATLVTALTVPIWLPVLALGYGIKAYTKLVMGIVDKITYESKIADRHSVIQLAFNRFARSLLYITSPVWLLIITPLANILIRRQQRLATGKGDKAPIGAKDENMEVTAMVDDQPTAYAKQKNEDKINKWQFGAILINAFPNTLMGMSAVAEVVKSWFAGASAGLSSAITSLGLIPGFLMSFIGLCTCYVNVSHRLQRAGYQTSSPSC